MTNIEIMLARNPADNQGVRFLLGSEALRAGNFDHACAVFEAEAPVYPPYYYELALCHILSADWVSAATALRRGFAANPHIAEILAENPNPAPLAIWHGTSMAEPRTASDYIRMYGMYWHNQLDSFAFDRWVFNHPKALAERAAIVECEEAVLWERDAAVRVKIVTQERLLVDRIDDEMSAVIVAKRTERYGHMAVVAKVSPTFSFEDEAKRAPSYSTVVEFLGEPGCTRLECLNKDGT